MDKQDADKFKDKVKELVDIYILDGGKVDTDKFLVKLYDYAIEQSRNYIPIREELAPNYGTGVNATQVDFNMMMSIISICWAVRMRCQRKDNVTHIRLIAMTQENFVKYTTSGLT
jgi:hypothetical protein